MFVVHSVLSGLDDDEVSTERNVAAVSPIPKIITTAIQDDSSRDEEDCRDEWGTCDVRETNVRNRYGLRMSPSVSSWNLVSDQYIQILLFRFSF